MELVTPKFFPSLAGLRVVLASFVFLHHFLKPADLNLSQDQSFVLIKFCMTTFFILSGFVITLTLLYNPPANLKEYYNFFLSKIIRLFPLYILLYSIPFLNINLPDLFVFFTNFVLLKGFFNNLYLTGIGPAWSLTTELTFYLFAPFIVKLLASRNKSLIVYFCFIFTGILFTTFGKLLTSLNLNPYGFFQTPLFTLEVTFFGRVSDFYIGVFFAYLIFNKKWLEIVFFKFYRPIYFSLSILTLICISFNFFNFHLDKDDILINISLQSILIPFVSGGLFYSLITEKSLLYKILSNKIMTFLSNGSYGFYLMHTSWVQFKLNKINPLPDNGFILLWITALLTYYLFEKNSIRYLRKRLMVQ